MVADITSVVPPWILLGVALGAVASVFVALVFYLGDRLLGPGNPDSEGGWETTGDDRRRREIREYLTATGERFQEEYGFDEVIVPFYLPEREVAITFDAHDYFKLEGEGIYAVLCEHEMPGRGLGRRLPFEVDEPDWGPDRTERRADGAVDAAFAELDVAREADATELKRAYRERVKETHPDQGGDEESFRRVREAYATARGHVEGGNRYDRANRTNRTNRESGANRADRTERSAPGNDFGR